MSVFEQFPEITIHFSKIFGTPIFTKHGKRIGKLNDFFVDYEEVYPTVIALQYKRNGLHFSIPWEEVKRFNFKKIIINDKTKAIQSKLYQNKAPPRKITNILSGHFVKKSGPFPPLGQIVLDRQIVDTHGKKVVRVNDIEFIKVGQNIKVTHAGIGLRSLIRRLGFEPIVDSIIRLIRPKAKYLTRDVLINWKYVHTIADRSVHNNVKLNLSNQDLKSLHPADLADILEDLDGHSRELIFNELEPEMAAKTLSEIDPDMQVSFIKKEAPEDVAKIIENMGPDEAADVLNELDDARAGAIISNIEDPETGEEIQELLEYKEDTAGGLMSTEVFAVSPDTKVSDIMKIIKDNHEEFESIYDLYIVDDNEILLGTCSLYKILIQNENLFVGEIMTKQHIISLGPSVHWKKLSMKMSKYNLINMPIVDSNNKLLGIVSVDDVLPWLLNER
ncbi:MAG: CBS domain-containing protein [Bacteriovoracaceae bacterium]|nr:CBS domain-containing protein [Bacteriovoracaceae bacterium]